MVLVPAVREWAWCAWLAPSAAARRRYAPSRLNCGSATDRSRWLIETNGTRPAKAPPELRTVLLWEGPPPGQLQLLGVGHTINRTFATASFPSLRSARKKSQGRHRL